MAEGTNSKEAEVDSRMTEQLGNHWMAVCQEYNRKIDLCLTEFAKEPAQLQKWRGQFEAEVVRWWYAPPFAKEGFTIRGIYGGNLMYSPSVYAVYDATKAKLLSAMTILPRLTEEERLDSYPASPYNARDMATTELKKTVSTTQTKLLSDLEGIKDYRWKNGKFQRIPKRKAATPKQPVVAVVAKGTGTSQTAIRTAKRTRAA